MIAEPISVQVGDPLARRDDFLDWLRRHGVEPKHTYRVEVEGESMVVYQYAVSAEGSKYIDWVGGEPKPAYREPFTVRIQEPMPR